MNENSNKLLFLNPLCDVIPNRSNGQVALINPLLKSWIKISYDAYLKIKRLSKSSGIELIEKQINYGTAKDEFLNLVNYLKNEQYIVTLSEHTKLSNEDIVENYIEMTKISLPKISKRIYLSLTSSCNLKCIHCYNTVNKPESSSMNEDKTIYNVIKKLKGNNVHEIILTGGEPFLRKDIFDIIRETSKITKNITINTNGLLINDQIIQSLKNYNYLTIAVSLDGLTKHTHEHIRGRNTFDKTLGNIILLIKNGIKTHIIATITKKNYRELIYFDKFVTDIGATGNLSYFTPVGTGKASVDSLRMDTKNINDYKKLLLKKYNGEILNQVKNKENNYLPVKFNCSAGIGILGIEHTGRVVPCHLFLEKEFSLGNILNESLLEIQRKWVIDGILAVDANSECQKCSIKHFCGNGCFANTYYTKGRYDAKDPNCTIHKQGIENMLWNCKN